MYTLHCYKPRTQKLVVTPALTGPRLYLHTQLSDRLVGPDDPSERDPIMRASPLKPLLLAGLLLAYAFAAGLPGAARAQAAPPPERLFEVLEAAVAELPAATFDFQAALTEIGSTDVAAIFAWVRDQTGYVAYRGALKGAAGVLMDREGNSLDRALLLERLLEEAGHQAVLARATLTDAALQAAASAQRRAPDPVITESDPAQLSQRAAAELGFDPAVLMEQLRATEQRDQAYTQAISTAAATQRDALVGALAAFPAGDAARSGVGQAADRNALLTDHWWVQVQQDGAYVDLDPTLPDAQPGTVVTAAEARFDLPEVRFLAAVDGACRDLACGDRLHRVHLAVIAEAWDGTSLSEQELTSTELLAVDGVLSSVAFAGLPEGWPDLDPFGSAQPLTELREELLATTSWRPALFVNGASVGSATIGADGKAGSSGGGGNAGAVGGLGGGLGGMFGGSSRSAAGAESESGAAFTALWLEYTVHTPGEGSVTERRQVFDLVGPAARAAGVTELTLTEEQRLERALALGGQTDILISGAGLSQEALSYAAAKRILTNRSAWSELYHQGQQLDPAVVNERLSDTAALFPPLDLLQAQRSERLAGYPSGAFVAAFHRRFEADLTVHGSFDLVAGAVSSLPGTDLWLTRVTQGALDTVLETELGAALASRSGAARPASVADAHGADLAAGTPWRVVASATELTAVAPDLPADLAARVLVDLQKGRLAAVPPGGSNAVGWYSLDLRSGAMLGRGERGWGQAATEYAETANVILQIRTAINQYAAMGRCLGYAITGPLRGLGPEDTDPQLQECVFTTICSGVHSALSMGVKAPVNWTNIIIQNSIDALWGGTPETGFGGLCGSLWNRIQGAG